MAGSSGVPGELWDFGNYIAKPVTNRLNRRRFLMPNRSNDLEDLKIPDAPSFGSYFVSD